MRETRGKKKNYEEVYSRSEDKAAPPNNTREEICKYKDNSQKEVPAWSRFLKGAFLPSKNVPCTKLARQRKDRKVRQKLDIAWYGGVEGQPVARSTV